MMKRRLTFRREQGAEPCRHQRWKGKDSSSSRLHLYLLNILAFHYMWSLSLCSSVQTLTEIRPCWCTSVRPLWFYNLHRHHSIWTSCKTVKFPLQCFHVSFKSKMKWQSSVVSCKQPTGGFFWPCMTFSCHVLLRQTLSSSVQWWSHTKGCLQSRCHFIADGSYRDSDCSRLRTASSTLIHWHICEI